MMTKAQAGSMGGRATVQRHGREYMSQIGRKGAQTTWQRYTLLPTGIGAYAMVHKDTGKIVAIIGS